LNASYAASSGTRVSSPRVLVALGAILAVTGALYWAGLSGDLVLDDAATLEPVARLAQGELTWSEALVQHNNFRPIAMASYMLNWLTTGDRVWPLKLTNLLVHLLCGVLVFLLSDRLLGRPVTGVDHRRPWVALWIAACWLLAPLLVSTVLYVTQRMAALVTLFTLAALLAYVHGRERIAAGRAGGLGLVAASLGVFWPLAILSKENGVLVPILIAVVELFFFAGGKSHAPGKQAADQAPRTARLVLAGSLAAAIVVGVAIAVAAPEAIFFNYAYRPFTAWERLLTEWRILFDYLANLLLLPGATPFGIYHDDYPKSLGLLEPATTLLAGIAWLVVLVIGWFTRGTRAGVLLFGLWFFLAAHLVESTLLPLELYFEHRNYLPSVGVFFALGYGGYLLLARARLHRLIAGALILVPLAFGAVTYHRVLVWQSWERMLLAALSHYPDSTRVNTGLANLYVNRGQLADALGRLNHAAAQPGAAQLALAAHALSAYCLAGEAPPSSVYRRVADAPATDDFYTTNTIAWLTDAIEGGECPVLDRMRTADALHRALRTARDQGVRDNSWLLHTHAARLLAAAGRRRDALEHLDLASRLEPEHLEAGLLALRYRLELAEFDQARRDLADLKRRDTGGVASHTRLIAEYERRLEQSEKERQPAQ
jgi:tetratricopeptide (TPR) repeat protein